MTDQKDTMPEEVWASSRPQDVGDRFTVSKCYDDQTRYVRADKPDAAAARASELVEVGYQYLFIDPMIGRDVWRNRSDEWNGQRPKASRKIYILKQEAGNNG